MDIRIDDLQGAPIAALLQEARTDNLVEITLCAENAAHTYSLQTQGLWSRMRHRFGSTDAVAVLQAI